MQNGNGREVVIVEAVRTPIGRGHPEKGYYKDTHPNELLGKCYSEVISRAASADLSLRAHTRTSPSGAATRASPRAIAPVPAIPSRSVPFG